MVRCMESGFRICCCVGSFVCSCLGNDEVHDENKDNIIYVLGCTHHPLTSTSLLGEGCVAVSASSVHLDHLVHLFTYLHLQC